MAAELLVGGALGFLLGRSVFASWEKFINRYNERTSHLSYNNIVEPVSFYGRIQNSRMVYGEAVYAYLFGLPNASVPASFRCLELALKKKYQETEKKSPKMNTYKLIEWSEKHLGNQKELAHGFRFLRNLIHEEKLVQEQDALEAIRHISKILNLLFPFETVILRGTCGFCNTAYAYEADKSQCFLGNVIIIPCSHCARNIRHEIMPLYS